MNRHKIQTNLQGHPEIKNIIAVASGKGGVGKSTTTVNLAVALSKMGLKVGILDGDIYGPSQAMMLGTEGAPDSDDGKTMKPFMVHGIQMNTMAALVDQDQPMVWRGPMVSRALVQLYEETHWQGLDVLFVDMPPGTGDIQLTLSQKIPVAGAVIVTTPQDIALMDAKRGVAMFEKVGITTLGVVENMSTHICSACGHEEAIFGQHGGEAMAEELGVTLLGQMPLDLSVRMHGDCGTPVAAAQEESDVAKRYGEMAVKLVDSLKAQPRDYSVSFGKIAVKTER